MPFVRAGQLCRETPVARPDDPLGLVAENLRESHYGTIPVVEGDLEPDGRPGRQSQMIGVIFERDLSIVALSAIMDEPARPDAVLATAPTPAAPTPSSPAGAPPSMPTFGQSTAATPSTATPSTLTPSGPTEPGYVPEAGLNGTPRTVSAMMARHVMRTDIGHIPSLFSLPNVLLALDRYGCDALPVVDEEGNYRGMISRADAVAALGGQVRPPVVGGMATPLGVWLTTGYLSAGVPPIGLALSGLFMFACFATAHLIMLACLSAIDPSWGAMFYTGRLGAGADANNAFNIAVTVAEGFLFLILIRLSPLAGYHAAEHQTVWAIERGVPLTPEFVRKMPRAHPRCGTNLVALAGLIQMVLGHLPTITPSNVLIALLFIYITWRNFGTALQQYFTTKPASPRQLESGIRAGKALLAKFQEQPHLETSFGSRLWNSGIGLAATGMIVAFFIFREIELMIARWLVF